MPYVDLAVGASATTHTSKTAELPSATMNKGSLGLQIGGRVLTAIKGTGIGTAITTMLSPTTVEDSTWGDTQYRAQQDYLNRTIGTSVSTISAKDEVSEIPKYTALHGYDTELVATGNVKTVRLPSVGAVEQPIVFDPSIPLSEAFYDDAVLRRARAGATGSIAAVTRLIDEAIDDPEATGVMIAAKPRQGLNGGLLLGVNGMPTYEDYTKGNSGVITPAKDLVIDLPKFHRETTLQMDKSGVLSISQSVVRDSRSDKKQKKDKKGRVGKIYRLALRIINNTVGHEMFELWMAFTDNLKTPEEEAQTKRWLFRKGFAPVYDPLTETWSYKPVTAKAAIEGFNDGTLELDVAGFMRDVVQNQIEDIVIAKLSQGAERWRASQGRVVGVQFGEAFGYREDFGQIKEGQRTEYFDIDEYIGRAVPNVEFSAKFRM
jgi:hypothetical protein